MKHWYRRPLVKIIALLLGIFSGAAYVTALGIAMTLAGTANPAGVIKMIREPYEDSVDFNTSVENMVMEVYREYQVRDLFETDGAYNPDKSIDIMEYARSGKADAGNVSGVSYQLGQLEDWAEQFSSQDDTALYSDNDVIVCRCPDGRYYYYYMEEFRSRVERGELNIQIQNSTQDQEEFLSELEKGRLTGSTGYQIRIYDGEGNELYTDCWNFGRSVREKYSPEGAANLLEAVNSNPQLNGKLSEIYENIVYILGNISDYADDYENGWTFLDEGNTNFTYLYVNRKTKQVYTNRAEYAGFKDSGDNILKMKSGDSVKYMIINPKLKDFETNMNVNASGEWNNLRTAEKDPRADSVLAVSVDTSYPVQDQFYEGKRNYDANLPLLRGSIVLLVSGTILFLISIVWLTVTAGRIPEDEELHLTTYDHWKTEIAMFIPVFFWGLVTWILLMTGFADFRWMDAAPLADQSGNAGQYYSGLYTTAVSISDLASIFFYGIFTFLCFFGGYISLIRRIKARCLWKGSLIRAILDFLGRAASSRHDTARAGVMVIVFVAVQLASALTGNEYLFFLALAADAGAVWFILSGAMAKARIRKGIEEIASGNMEYRIDLEGLRKDEQDMAAKVNDIGGGLNRAVDEAMRNERLKTDLITNVSHDIKTPLTSIINYVDILKRSNIKDEKVQGYLDILESKAQRLKTLTEDVVEASKVSSGNITLECMNVDLRELVQQTEGEMAEKFMARRLTVVLNIPDEPAVIYVDGRRMWRVLENIYGNAAKYAMPGTRIYSDLSVTDDRVILSLKNVSEQQLNITADELTERFIRGDLSRSTEGSGLGLSIAKSLTAMQGGEFSLYLDGDLFRVTISFPRVPAASREAPEQTGEETQPENPVADSGLK